MKPPPLTYHAAESVEEAVALMAEHGDEAKVLAGGQSLVPLLNLRLAAPSHVVDIMRIPELAGLARRNGHIEVGAGVRQAEAEDDPELMTACPLLAAALPHVAHREIRNAGTICGSVAHGDPAAEVPVAALALGAEMAIQGPAGERVVPARDFFRSYLETALQPEELLVGVRLPIAEPGSGASFQELARRAGDYAIAGAAAAVTVRGGIVERIGVACLGVAGVPVRVDAAEDELRGTAPDSEAIAGAAHAAAASLDPPGDVHASPALRRRVAEVLIRRAIADAVERATEGER